MPSPTKKKAIPPVNEKYRITNFFKRAAPIPIPTPSQNARSTPTPGIMDPPRSPARSLTSELTSLASATPEPHSPRQDVNTTPRMIPILADPELLPDAPIRSPTRSSAPMGLPTTSFTSTSSLTSLPYSSGCSQRKTGEDGLMEVANSDEDEDDILPDVGYQEPSHNLSSSTPGSGSTMNSSGSRYDGIPISKSTSHQPQRPISKTPANPNPDHKSSLAKLIREREEAERSRARIAEMEASVAKADEILQQLEEQAPNISSEQLLGMLNDNGVDGDRIKTAIDRTEALKNEERFEFFSSTQPCAAELDFPADSLPNAPWANVLRKEQSRTQACLTGFVAELGTSGRLPPEVTRWFAFELVREVRVELRDAYVTIIQTCVNHKHSVHGSLSSLGTYYPCGKAKETQMQSDSQLSGSTAKATDSSEGPFAGLADVVKVIQASAPNAGTDIASRAVADLVLAGLDARIASDMALKVHMENAIEGLLNTLPEQKMEDVTEYLRERFFDDERLSPAIQCQTVLAFPTRSIASHNLRRHLAFYCITHEKQSRNLESPNWPKAILSRMSKSEEFYVNDNATNYDLLIRLAAVLDIAIDSGFSSNDYPWLDPAPATELGKKSLWAQLDEQSPAEKAFNTQIDGFALRISKITSRINNVGMAHLKRHEARAALENVELRLQQSVRTHPPRRKGILDGDSHIKFQKSMMHRFTKMVTEMDEKEAKDEAAL